MASTSRRMMEMRRKASSELTTDDLFNHTAETEFNNSIKQFLHKRMEEVITLSETLIMAAPHEDKRNQLIDSCQMSLKSLIINELTLIKADKISEELAQKCIANVTKTDPNKIWNEIENIDKQTNKAMAEYKIKEKHIHGHPMFVKLQQKINEMSIQLASQSADENNTSVMCDDHIPTIDPITKTALVDPIKNSICGHVYGQAAIEQLIKSSTKIRCPAVGCDNRTFLQKKHLIEDPVLAAKIRNQIAKMGSQVGNTSEPIEI